jgi:biopolymer transport protein ExbB/TolQ
MDIKQELLNLPLRIACVEDQLVERQIALEDVNCWLKLWELEQGDQINNATDDYGKPVFSNDAKRRAELERRKHVSQEYQENESARAALNVAIKRLEIDLKKHYNTQGNLRSICRLSDAGESEDCERAG